jgi:hypothetical protein
VSENVGRQCLDWHPAGLRAAFPALTENKKTCPFAGMRACFEGLEQPGRQPTGGDSSRQSIWLAKQDSNLQPFG